MNHSDPRLTEQEHLRVLRYLDGSLPEAELPDVEALLESSEEARELAKDYGEFRTFDLGQAVEPSASVRQRLDEHVRALLAHPRRRRLLQWLQTKGLELIDTSSRALSELGQQLSPAHSSWKAAASGGGIHDFSCQEVEAAGETQLLEGSFSHSDGQSEAAVFRLVPGWTWSEERIDMLLECPLTTAGYPVTILWRLSQPSSSSSEHAPEPARVVSLYSGRIDEDGLVHIETVWPINAVALPNFQADRLIVHAERPDDASHST